MRLSVASKGIVIVYANGKNGRLDAAKVFFYNSKKPGALGEGKPYSLHFFPMNT